MVWQLKFSGYKYGGEKWSLYIFVGDKPSATLPVRQRKFRLISFYLYFHILGQFEFRRAHPYMTVNRTTLYIVVFCKAINGCLWWLHQIKPRVLIYEEVIENVTNFNSLKSRRKKFFSLTLMALIKKISLLNNGIKWIHGLIIRKDKSTAAVIFIVVIFGHVFKRRPCLCGL